MKSTQNNQTVVTGGDGKSKTMNVVRNKHKSNPMYIDSSHVRYTIADKLFIIACVVFVIVFMFCIYSINHN